MPNFRAKNLQLRLPCECDGVSFLAASEWQNDCALVLAQINDASGGAGEAAGVRETAGAGAAAGGQKTLVQVSRRKGYFVCKIDKVSKLSDLSAMQRVLAAFMKACCSEIIDAACAQKATQKPAANLLATAEELAQVLAATDAAGAGAGAAATAGENPLFSQKLPTPSENPLFSQKPPAPETAAATAGESPVQVRAPNHPSGEAIAAEISPNASAGVLSYAERAPERSEGHSAEFTRESEPTEEISPNASAGVLSYAERAPERSEGDSVKFTRESEPESRESEPQQRPVRVHFEVGFGSGRHLLALATQHPQDLFIGAEIHRPSLLQTSRLAAAQNLANVYLLDADARVLAAALPPRSFDAVYVHFPVPWPSAPQRRVISADFAAALERLLRPGGLLELRTDDGDYFAYAQEIFSARKHWQLSTCVDEPDVCVSKYEARWQRANKQIFSLQARYFGPTPPAGAAEIKGLKIKAFRKIFVQNEGVFAKISRVYQCKDFCFALAHFGEPDAPQSAYLQLNNGANEASFMLKPVLKTPANAAALRLLEEALC